MNLEKTQDTPLGFILISIFWILLAIWILFIGVQSSAYTHIKYRAIIQFPFILAGIALIFIGWGVLSLTRFHCKISVSISLVISYIIVLLVLPSQLSSYYLEFYFKLYAAFLIAGFFTYSILFIFSKKEGKDYEMLFTIGISYLIPFLIFYFVIGRFGLRYFSIGDSFLYLISIPIYFIASYIIVKKYEKYVSTISFLISLIIILIVMILTYRLSFRSYFEVSNSNIIFYFYMAFSTIAFYLLKNRDFIIKNSEEIKVKLK